MKEFLSIFSNIKGGIVSTFLGFVLFIFGGVLIYNTYKSDEVVAWASVETGIFGVGAYLLVLSDEWINSLFNKNNEDNE